MQTTCLIVFFLISFYKSGLGGTPKYWQGNWFPHDPGSADTNDAVDNSLIEKLNHNSKTTDLSDALHGIKMGIPDPNCDDGKKNITVDWNGSSSDYTCFKKRYRINYHIKPVKHCTHVPKKFLAKHWCMNHTIHYDDKIPTYGDHRPLWATYGEYTYVPKQRWLHNLEHGGIVMLYHPCTDTRQVHKLRKILRSCLWKHIITTYNGLTEERPLALLSWGCHLFMNVVDRKITIEFIKNNANKGPEKQNGQGFYNVSLIYEARLVTDQNDTQVCTKLRN